MFARMRARVSCPSGAVRAAGFAMLVAAGAAIAAGAARSATLTVRVEDLRSAEGVVRVAVFATAEDFMERGREFRTAVVPASAAGVTVEFADLPAGTYALSMFHDEDDDDEFDQVAFGLPLEGFGFSNDAPVLFSAPSFKSAAFAVSEPATEIAARMRYWAASSGRNGDAEAAWPRYEDEEGAEAPPAAAAPGD